jgi:CheY-like chemotaxis protein
MIEPTTRRILIVEDEPIIGLALEDMLECIGWQTVAIAARVQQALDLIASVAVDAAILDVNLHGERSYPVADDLAARGIPYIFATGYGDTEHPERHRCAPTITKPYVIADVETALAAA